MTATISILLRVVWLVLLLGLGCLGEGLMMVMAA